MCISPDDLAFVVGSVEGGGGLIRNPEIDDFWRKAMLPVGPGVVFVLERALLVLDGDGLYKEMLLAGLERALLVLDGDGLYKEMLLAGLERALVVLDGDGLYKGILLVGPGILAMERAFLVLDGDVLYKGI